MEIRDNLLIVVDAGHGGWDNGASYQGRLEKDDNLRLALEVRRQLEALGVGVLMTRDTDVFVELSDRAEIANRAGADLFISLHRNSYIEQTPSTNGVENWIYLTASETAERAATLVLDEVVSVGVQSNRGVRRGNYYVVRRTVMPSMLLEMGYIINEEDNRLFDEKLVEYAKAIACGAVRFFEPSHSCSTPAPPVEPPAPPPQGAELVKLGQKSLNLSFGGNLIVDGLFGPKTKEAAVRALQITINNLLNKNIAVDGIIGPETIAAIPNISIGSRGEPAVLVQTLLALNNYDAGGIDGVFGNRTKSAVQMFQRDHYLEADGVAGPKTILRMLRH